MSETVDKKAVRAIWELDREQYESDMEKCKTMSRETFALSWRFGEKEDCWTLMVRQKMSDGHFELVNGFTGEEAFTIYQVLTQGKEEFVDWLRERQNAGEVKHETAEETNL